MKKYIKPIVIQALIDSQSLLVDSVNVYSTPVDGSSARSKENLWDDED